MRGSLLCLLLIGSLTAARAESSLTWDSWMREGEAVINYGAPESDDVRFSIVCKVSDGTGRLSADANLVGVKDGERVNFTVGGPGGTISYTGVFHEDRELGANGVSVDLRSARDALTPLSKPGTLTIRFPKNSFIITVPLGPKAAQALNTFRSQCPPAKQSSK